MRGVPSIRALLMIVIIPTSSLPATRLFSMRVSSRIEEYRLVNLLVSPKIATSSLSPQVTPPPPHNNTIGRYHNTDDNDWDNFIMMIGSNETEINWSLPIISKGIELFVKNIVE
jgi:hypothetical protein